MHVVELAFYSLDDCLVMKPGNLPGLLDIVRSFKPALAKQFGKVRSVQCFLLPVSGPKAKRDPPNKPAEDGEQTDSDEQQRPFVRRVKYRQNMFHVSRWCAEYHSDVHLNSQLKEAVQVLSTVYGGPYKPTHQNHPCTKWVAASPANASWALALACALHLEWIFRFGKTHGSGLLLPEVADRIIVRDAIERHTPFAQVMPEQYRVDGDAVAAYRAYYNAEKQGFWVRRAKQPPRWRAAKWTHARLVHPTACAASTAVPTV